MLFLLFFLSLSFLMALGWGVFYETDRLVVREDNIPLSQWDLPPLTIGVLSDIHAGSPHIDAAKIKLVVEKINAAKPDIILLAGDFVIDGVLGGQFMEPAEIGQLLSALHAPLGVYAVTGNHEWGMEAQAMKDALDKAGIIVLSNESVQVPFGNGDHFWLAGIGDYKTGYPDIKAVMKNIRSDKRPAIALTHIPDIFSILPARVALGIGGHTHGGQISIPFYGPLLTNSEFGQRYAGGVVREGIKTFFISRGIGTSILPVRIGVPPEINILHITLKLAKQE